MGFEIIEISQKKIKDFRKLKLKKYRYLTNTFISEGYRLFTASSNHKSANISEVLLDNSYTNISRRDYIVEECKNKKIPLYSCSTKEIKSISDEKTPSGIIFTSKLQVNSNEDLYKIKKDNCLYLENIADPGNLGTIIRTAAWYGIEDILLSPNSVDPFNMKVVRASAGGIYCVRIFENILLEPLKDFAISNNYELISTVVQGGVLLNNWKVSQKNIIFLGSEANGLSDAARQIIDQSVSIPGCKKIESLNLSVTAGIILNHLKI